MKIRGNIMQLHMMDLKNQLKRINDVIPRGAKVCYFDYPVHNNVGDMLIWKGTEQFFKECKIRVVKRFSHHLIDYLLNKQDKFIEIQKENIIVCHGGGNFGDLYSVHQKTRKLLVEKFINNRIVFLPQSIHYENKQKMQEDFTVFRKHKDLHLYVRDKKSFLIASKYLENVYLCQDMAHALYPINKKKTNKSNCLYFLRKDKERVDSHIINAERVNEFDWHLLFSKIDLKIYRLLIRAHRSYKIQKIISPNLLSKLWYIFISHMINKAINFFNGYQTIITSRLHGHILA
ncbi:polysaccharide pyruvyl transferase family protein, partial [Neobacillus drentensis]